MANNQAVWDDQRHEREVMANLTNGQIEFFEREYYSVRWDRTAPDLPVRRRLLKQLRERDDCSVNTTRGVAKRLHKGRRKRGIRVFSPDDLV
jgi:hypothetical protein